MHFFDPSPILIERHMRWLDSVLRDPHRRLLMAQADGEPVACVRVDIEAATARVSIYVDPERTGKGLGAAALDATSQWLVEHEQGVDRIEANILPNNLASRGAFESAGYVLSHLTYVKPIVRS